MGITGKRKSDSEQPAVRAVQAQDEVQPKAFSCLSLRASDLRLQGGLQSCRKEWGIASPGLKHGMTWCDGGCGAVGLRGRREQRGGHSTQAPSFLMRFYRYWESCGSFVWGLSPWWETLSVLLTSKELYHFENIQFLDLKSLSLLLLLPHCSGFILPLFVHLRNKLALQMTYADCSFAFYRHKSKGLLFHKCVNWAKWKTSINMRKDYLLFF